MRPPSIRGGALSPAVALLCSVGLGCGHVDDRAQRRLLYLASMDLVCPEDKLAVEHKRKQSEVTGCGQHESFRFDDGDWVPVGGDERPARSRVHHSCYGAKITIHLPEGTSTVSELFKAGVVTEEDDSSPPPEDGATQSRGWPLAAGVARVLDARVAGIRCQPTSDQFAAYVSCSGPKTCRTTKEEGRRFLAGVKELLGPEVPSSLNTCPCRNYR